MSCAGWRWKGSAITYINLYTGIIIRYIAYPAEGREGHWLWVWFNLPIISHLLERGLEGSAAIVGKPVADVTVEKVMLLTRGLEVWKIIAIN